MRFTSFSGSILLGTHSHEISFSTCGKLVIEGLTPDSALDLINVLEGRRTMAEPASPAEVLARTVASLTQEAPTVVAVDLTDVPMVNGANAIPLTTSPIVMTRVTGPSLEVTQPPALVVEPAAAPRMVTLQPVRVEEVKQEPPPPASKPVEAPAPSPRQRRPRTTAQPVQVELPMAMPPAAPAEAVEDKPTPMVYDDVRGEMRPANGAELAEAAHRGLRAPVKDPLPAPPMPETKGDPWQLAPASQEPAKPTAVAAAPSTPAKSIKIEEVQELTKFKDILTYLLDRGVNESDLVSKCLELKEECPVIRRINNLEDRTSRTLEVMKIESGV